MIHSSSEASLQTKVHLTFFCFLEDIDSEPKSLPLDAYIEYLEANPGIVPLYFQRIVHEITLEDNKAVAFRCYPVE